jgi:hypothetical protein
MRHVYDNETVYSANGWSIRTFTDCGYDFTMLYEDPGDSEWITDMAVANWHGHLSEHRIKSILKQMTAGKHND